MLKIIFSSLAARDNQSDNTVIANGTLAESVQVDPIVVSTEAEKKEKFMKLLVPKENIGKCYACRSHCSVLNIYLISL